LPNGFSICDYILASVVAGIFLLFPSIGIDLSSWRKPIRFLAKRTFSLYLYHFPLLRLLQAIVPSGPDLRLRQTIIILLTLLICLILANYSELRKKSLAKLMDRAFFCRARSCK